MAQRESVFSEWPRVELARRRSSPGVELAQGGIGPAGFGFFGVVQGGGGPGLGFGFFGVETTLDGVARFENVYWYPEVPT